MRYEEVTIVQQVPGYLSRWLINLENGDLLKMPPPEGMTFEIDAKFCARLLRGPWGNLKARQAETRDCA